MLATETLQMSNSRLCGFTRGWGDTWGMFDQQLSSLAAVGCPIRISLPSLDSVLKRWLCIMLVLRTTKSVVMLLCLDTAMRSGSSAPGIHRRQGLWPPGKFSYLSLKTLEAEFVKACQEVVVIRTARMFVACQIRTNVAFSCKYSMVQDGLDHWTA